MAERLITLVEPAADPLAPIIRQTITQVERRVYDRLVECASRGARCPYNSDFHAETGSWSTATSAKIIASLETKGWIVVQRGANSRVVTILETGQSTAGEVGKPHFSRPNLAPASTALARLCAPDPGTLPPRQPSPAREIGARRAEISLANKQDIATRIDADQARLRAEREQWLVREQQKYNLPRRARLIDEMPA